MQATPAGSAATVIVRYYWPSFTQLNNTVKAEAFLTPDTEQIRHQIKGLIESYSHEWDILAELVQNSVDAIRTKASGKGHVQLQIDCTRAEITVRDNGVGIDPTEIAKLLRPFGTNKVNRPNQIGEKGVGLKFIMFTSNTFEVTTVSAAGGCLVKVNDAAAWVNSSSQETLSLHRAEAPKEFGQGTQIKVRLSDQNHPIFSFGFQELLYLLRTKTACGDCGFIWKDPLDADVALVHIDKGGKKSEKEFEARYLLPIECASVSDAISFDEFDAWLKEADRSDTEKRKKLFNKIVTLSGKSHKGGREIRYWSCFVPRREFWRTLTTNFGIPAPDIDATAEEVVELGFSGGLVTSTKGMPTGISIELKPRGSAGYVPNFFMLVDDPSLRFDIGRKSVQGRQQGMLRELAYQSFREYINKARKYMGGDIDPETSRWDRDEVFEEIDELPDLDSSVSRFVKRPNNQEATVAAMFFEQIGKGEFPDLFPLISGYKGRYDLYAKWKKRRMVLEFKYDLQGLFKDFSDERKMFDEIDALIVWEVTELDRTIAARRGIVVGEVTISTLVKDAKTFPNATKTLSLGDSNPIYIVELKALVDKPS